MYYEDVQKKLDQSLHQQFDLEYKTINKLYSIRYEFMKLWNVPIINGTKKTKRYKINYFGFSVVREVPCTKKRLKFLLSKLDIPFNEEKVDSSLSLGNNFRELQNEFLLGINLDFSLWISLSKKKLPVKHDDIKSFLIFRAWKALLAYCPFYILDIDRYLGIENVKVESCKHNNKLKFDRIPFIGYLQNNPMIFFEENRRLFNKKNSVPLSFVGDSDILNNIEDYRLG